MSASSTGPLATYPGLNSSSPSPAVDVKKKISKFLGLEWYWWVIIGISILIFLIGAYFINKSSVDPGVISTV